MALSDATGPRTDRRGGPISARSREASPPRAWRVVSRDLPTLFGTTGDDVRLALGKLAAPDHFARLARDFFARLTLRHLMSSRVHQEDSSPRRSANASSCTNRTVGCSHVQLSSGTGSGSDRWASAFVNEKRKFMSGWRSRDWVAGFGVAAAFLFVAAVALGLV